MASSYGGDHLPARQRQATILAADLVGYSKLMAQDEAGTFVRVKALLEEVIIPEVQHHQGRIFKTLGDGVLIEHSSPTDAVRCAIAVQKVLDNTSDKPYSGFHIRIGINTDNVFADINGDLYGDCVNVASRLEGMARPDGILMSEQTWKRLGTDAPDRFFDNGFRRFKNIDRPIRVWSWPSALPSLKASRKPRVFVGGFAGNDAAEDQLGTDINTSLIASLNRLTGIETASSQDGCDYVVEGRVRLAEQTARVLSIVSSSNSDRQVWADQYALDPQSLFNFLEQITPKIAMGIRRAIAADDAALLADRPLDELSFEETLAVASARFSIPTEAGWHSGGEIAQRALEFDPQDFMALSMAASGLGLSQFLYGYGPGDPQVLSLAFKRIGQALQMNARSDMAHVTHAGLLLYGRRRHRDAAAAAKRALEINPGYNMGLWALGSCQVFCGQCEEAIRSSEEAISINLSDPYVHQYCRIAGYGHLGAGRLNAAMDWFQRADQLAPGVPQNLRALIVASQLAASPSDACYYLERLLEDFPDFRVSNMCPLPFADESVSRAHAAALVEAGAPR